MFRNEIQYFVILTILILLAPFLPSGLLILLDNIVIRVVIVAVLLYCIHVGPTVGIFGLIAISALYLERNRRKVGLALEKLDAMEVPHAPQATVKEASTPQKTVPVREFDIPAPTESVYVPEDDGSNQDSNFEPVDQSINQKAVLSTIYPLSSNSSGSASQHLFEKMGVGHIEGIETLGESN
jgi:hypothetical protein